MRVSDKEEINMFFLCVVGLNHINTVKCYCEEPVIPFNSVLQIWGWDWKMPIFVALANSASLQRRSRDLMQNRALYHCTGVLVTDTSPGTRAALGPNHIHLALFSCCWSWVCVSQTWVDLSDSCWLRMWILEIVSIFLLLLWVGYSFTANARVGVPLQLVSPVPDHGSAIAFPEENTIYSMEKARSKLSQQELTEQLSVPVMIVCHKVEL